MSHPKYQLCRNRGRSLHPPVPVYEMWFIGGGAPRPPKSKDQCFMKYNLHPTFVMSCATMGTLPPASLQREGFASHRRIMLFCSLPTNGIDHGNIGAMSTASVSGRPNITFMFCIAWPLAPLTRLSMDTKTIARPGKRSARTFMNTWLLWVDIAINWGVRTWRCGGEGRGRYCQWIT